MSGSRPPGKSLSLIVSQQDKSNHQAIRRFLADISNHQKGQKESSLEKPVNSEEKQLEPTVEEQLASVIEAGLAESRLKVQLWQGLMDTRASVLPYIRLDGLEFRTAYALEESQDYINFLSTLETFMGKAIQGVYSDAQFYFKGTPAQFTALQMSIARLHNQIFPKSALTILIQTEDEEVIRAVKQVQTPFLGNQAYSGLPRNVLISPVSLYHHAAEDPEIAISPMTITDGSTSATPSPAMREMTSPSPQLPNFFRPIKDTDGGRDTPTILHGKEEDSGKQTPTILSTLQNGY